MLEAPPASVLPGAARRGVLQGKSPEPYNSSAGWLPGVRRRQTRPLASTSSVGALLFSTQKRLDEVHHVTHSCRVLFRRAASLVREKLQREPTLVEKVWSYTSAGWHAPQEGFELRC